MTRPADTGKAESRLSLALSGAIGAVAPDILLLYSKRWTMPAVTFDFNLFLYATVMYVLLAGFVAYIFPYSKFRLKKDGNRWIAFCIGFSLPLIVAGFAAFTRGQLIIPRGETVEGNFWDLLALF